jgi:hypothetical protein
MAEGKLERLPDLASDLVRSNVAVIVAWTTLGVRAAKLATTTIPIVRWGAGDGTDDFDAFFLEHAVRQMSAHRWRASRAARGSSGRQRRPALVTDARVNRQG